MKEYTGKEIIETVDYKALTDTTKILVAKMVDNERQ